MVMQLFPLTARINARGHLELGGCDVVELAREFGTPLYIFDEAHLRARATQVRDAFSARWQNALVLYATKAYYSPYLARLFTEAGLGIDVTSEGELEIARRVGLDPDKIYLHGNNKTPAEIRAALTQRVTHIVVDNLDEIELLAQLADELDVTPRVLLRLAPAIDSHTHRYLATGVVESKFGLPLQTGAVLEAARRIVQRAPPLTLVGLHAHIGSQIFDVQPYRDTMALLLECAAELHAALGFELQELDLGGGWGVPYTEAQTPLTIEQVAETIVSDVAFHSARLKLETSNLKLVCEPGRALIAASAVALYTVGAVKDIPGVTTYVAVDGGMGDNIRPALYGATYTARVANKMNDTPTQRVAIAGRYCEQGDILIHAVELPRVARGDLIAMPVAGAYQLAMASNYNLIPRPAVIAVSEGNARLVRRRETVEDLLRCDIEA